jgi:hypothetical protein
MHVGDVAGVDVRDFGVLTEMLADLGEHPLLVALV